MKYALGVLVILCLATVAAADPGNSEQAGLIEKPANPLRCTIKPLSDEITLGVPFGLEVTLENTSGAALAIPDPRGPTSGNGWLWVFSFWKECSVSQPVHPLTWALVETPEDAQPAVKSIRVLGAESSYRFTIWDLWDDTCGLPQRVNRTVPPEPGRKVEMRVRFQMPDFFLKDHASDFPAKPWTGFTESTNIETKVVRAEPAKVVAMVLAGARKLKLPEDRCLARETLARMTCRNFGKGPGMTDEDLAAAEKWFESNGAKGQQPWIVAALSSKDAAERKEAAVSAALVKDPALVNDLVAALNTSEPDISAKVLDALWTNYDDPRAVDYARKVLADTSLWVPRADVINLAFMHKVQPIMKEVGEAIPGWIEAEKNEQMLSELISVVRRWKIEKAIPVLESLDDRRPTPAPKELILALAELVGKDYEPRLIEHFQQNPDPVARRWAVAALSSWATKPYIDAFTQALDDPNIEIREVACSALAKWGRSCTLDQRDKAAAILIRLLDTDEQLKRDAIESALANLYANFPGWAPKEEDRHKAAEKWREVLRTARMK
jgi:HEAT repeat protein